MIKFKYKGRTFSSPRSLANAMQRELNNSVERHVRRVASANGLTVRKTSEGLEVRRDANMMGRFYNRFGR